MTAGTRRGRARARHAALPGPVDARRCVSCHGVVMTVRPSNARLFDGLRALLPPGAACVAPRPADVEYEWTYAPGDAAGDATLHRVRVHDPAFPAEDVLACTADAREAAARLADDFEFRVALYARDRVFVHAAALAWQDRAIILPGRSFAGKSTLAAALVRAGATYLSDEWAVLRPDGRVQPFPRRLRLRDPAGAPLGAVSARRLGGRVATRPLPVGLVAWTTFQVGASWRPARMSSGEIALALLDNAPAARRRPGYALRLIVRAVDGAVGLRGARGDADITARQILYALTARAEGP